MAGELNGAANGTKPQRSWDDTVRVRGVRILLQMVMPILHDMGDQNGRATKAGVRDIQQHGEHFTFVLEVSDGYERGRLVGPRFLHLSALSLLFRVALRATFKMGERPDVVVGIWEPAKGRVLMPEGLVVESDLEPEEPVHAPTEETDGDAEPPTAE